MVEQFPVAPGPAMFEVLGQFSMMSDSPTVGHETPNCDPRFQNARPQSCVRGDLKAGLDSSRVEVLLSCCLQPRRSACTDGRAVAACRTENLNGQMSAAINLCIRVTRIAWRSVRRWIAVELEFV